MNEEITSQELVARFSRCERYPEDKQGINFLADGLERASESAGVSMLEIVEACAAISRFCPTDAELLTVARNIRDEHRREEESKRDQKAEWEKQYGKPEPFRFDAGSSAKGFDWKADAARIMPASKEHWSKDAAMLKLMHARAKERGIKLEKMGHHDFLTLQVECQEIVGIEVTPEQRRAIGR